MVCELYLSKAVKKTKDVGSCPDLATSSLPDLRLLSDLELCMAPPRCLSSGAVGLSASLAPLVMETVPGWLL